MNENTPIPERLKMWKACLEAGNIEEAILHHDAVQSHIVEHQDSQRVFALAEMHPGPFVEWARLKTAIKEQLGKSYEQRKADYEEGIEQLVDLVEKLNDAETSTEAIKWVSKFNQTLQQVTINAAHLDELVEEADEEPEEVPEEPSAPEEPEETREEPTEEAQPSEKPQKKAGQGSRKKKGG